MLSVVHWAWFMEPHIALLIVQARDPVRFARAARQMAVTYDVGCAIYFAVPTAPPWWAAEEGYIEPPVERVATDVAGAEAPHVRRIMVDAGEQVWRDAWQPLYDSFNSNPWAAMPSLHFATSLMAALHLSKVGQVGGRRRLGLRGHAGLRARLPRRALRHRPRRGRRSRGTDRRGEPLAEPAVEAVNRVLRRLEAIAA